MKTWLSILALLVLLVSLAGAVGETDGNKYDSAYKKAKIKNRARLQAEDGEKFGGNMYIYVDDEAMDDAIEKSKGDNQFSIASPTLKDGVKVKELNIYVESRKDKKIELDKMVGEEGKAEIGHVHVEEGADVKAVKSIIELKSLEVKNK
jgi:hypothetical protein